MAITQQDLKSPAGSSAETGVDQGTAGTSLHSRLNDLDTNVGSISTSAGAGTDAAVLPGVAGSLHGHVREAQEQADSIYARQGAPAGASQSADLAAVKAVVDLAAVDTTTAKEATLGAPAGASMSADIAAVKAVVDLAAVDTTTAKEATLGAPAGASMSADLAAIKTVVDLAATLARQKFQTFRWGNNVITNGGANNYLSPGWSTFAADVAKKGGYLCQEAGTISKLYARASAAAGAVATPITVYKNHVASALTCDMNGVDSKSDLVNSVAVAAGDVITVHVDAAANPTLVDLHVQVRYDVT